MIIAIIGSTTFKDYNSLKRFLDRKLKDKDIEYIISGEDRGTDSFVKQYADENNIPTKIIKTEWEKLGKSAYYTRNIIIIDECDYLIAFWDGKSQEIKHSIDLVKNRNKPFDIYHFDKRIKVTW